jgi:thioredoxin reductase (NADPH)
MYDVIIIGSGPAGLTAGIYSSRAELKTLILAGDMPGGQLTITTDVENFPGFPEGIAGGELMNRMMKQATRFGAELVMESVKKTDFTKSTFIVETDKGKYQGRSVVIATGAEARWLGIESEEKLRGKGISICATCDGFFFRGKDVAVIGGGDAAMEEANFLTKFVNHVTVIHKLGEFQASKIMLARARSNPKITFLKPFGVVEFLGNDKLEGVKIKNSETGDEQTVKCEGVFLAIGRKPATDLFSGQLELTERGYIAVKNHTQTSVPGVFSAGDVGDPRYRQAVSSAGLGCMAAMDAERYLAEQDK